MIHDDHERRKEEKSCENQWLKKTFQHFVSLRVFRGYFELNLM